MWYSMLGMAAQVLCTKRNQNVSIVYCKHCHVPHSAWEDLHHDTTEESPSVSTIPTTFVAGTINMLLRILQGLALYPSKGGGTPNPKCSNGICIESVWKLSSSHCCFSDVLPSGVGLQWFHIFQPNLWQSCFKQTANEAMTHWSKAR